MPKLNTNRWWSLALILMTLAAMLASSVQADPRRPMVEVGAGAFAADGGDVSLLLSVAYRGASLGYGNEILDIYAARLRGQVAIGALGNSGDPVPYMDIEFTPVAIGAVVNGAEVMPGDILGLIQALPIHVSRNVAIGRDLSATVNLAGVEFRTPLTSRYQAGATAFAHVAVAALGYKISAIAEQQRLLHGFSVARGDVQVGLASGGQNGAFRISLAFGLQGDFAVSGGSNGGAARLQLDSSVYAEMRAHLGRFFQVFVRGSWNALVLSGEETRTDLQLIAGAGFVF